MNTSRLSWYWHRLRAMTPPELAAHLRKKFYQISDGSRKHNWGAIRLDNDGSFPVPLDATAAPKVLRAALERDTEEILSGRWRAFGSLELKVDAPPLWQKDYLVGQDLQTREVAFRLNHRELPGGADIKLIWELSRWNQLVRLAQAAYVLDDARAGQKCTVWLADWVARNPPYQGWNWTSTLESAMRMLQFAWIDALLSAKAQRWGLHEKLEHLRRKILPPHAWFSWRHKAFGSSANNHLLGELTGLIVATVRWPGLQQCCAGLDVLQERWEREVLAQFAEDGGNREQALNYHLFAWEFCWQSRLALKAAGRQISPPVEERLASAARYFVEVQQPGDPWDYGDSDNAWVTPVFVASQTALQEWCDWLGNSDPSGSIHYWLGRPPVSSGRTPQPSATKSWRIYPDTGMALCKTRGWQVRWDLSPLGYLRLAAHGHLDAQHLTLWRQGVAVVIDPGTGTYYGDAKLRGWLASRAAHNGPCPSGPEFPKRLGPFLWSNHHQPPTWQGPADSGNLRFSSELALPRGTIRRAVSRVQETDGWLVEDEFDPASGFSPEFFVHWQFAPETQLKRLDAHTFSVTRSSASLHIVIGTEWAEIDAIANAEERAKFSKARNEFEGFVSPAFRRVVFAPYIRLTAKNGNKPCVFTTAFLASEPRE